MPTSCHFSLHSLRELVNRHVPDVFPPLPTFNLKMILETPAPRTWGISRGPNIPPPTCWLGKRLLAFFFQQVPFYSFRTDRLPGIPARASPHTLTPFASSQYANCSILSFVPYFLVRFSPSTAVKVSIKKATAQFNGLKALSSAFIRTMEPRALLQ